MSNQLKRTYSQYLSRIFPSRTFKNLQKEARLTLADSRVIIFNYSKSVLPALYISESKFHGVSHESRNSKMCWREKNFCAAPTAQPCPVHEHLPVIYARSNVKSTENNFLISGLRRQAN